MSKRAKEQIPHDILEAAEAAGFATPLWYAGRTNGQERKPLVRSANEIIIAGRKRAGISTVTRIALPPIQPDPFAPTARTLAKS